MRNPRAATQPLTVAGVVGGEKALRTASITGAVTFGVTFLLHLWDPNRSGSYGFCPLRVATGLLCPLCGGLRAVHALTHGQWETAWGMNPVVVALLPLALAAWALWMWRARRGHVSTYLERMSVFVPVISALVVFGVLRNVPVFQTYLAPLT